MVINKVLRCQDCKKKNKTVRRRRCPFAHDVEDKTIFVTICDECHNERAEDI